MRLLTLGILCLWVTTVLSQCPWQDVDVPSCDLAGQAGTDSTGVGQPISTELFPPLNPSSGMVYQIPASPTCSATGGSVISGFPNVTYSPTSPGDQTITCESKACIDYSCNYPRTYMSPAYNPVCNPSGTAASMNLRSYSSPMNATAGSTSLHISSFMAPVVGDTWVFYQKYGASFDRSTYTIREEDITAGVYEYVVVGSVTTISRYLWEVTWADGYALQNSFFNSPFDNSTEPIGSSIHGFVIIQVLRASSVNIPSCAILTSSIIAIDVDPINGTFTCDGVLDATGLGYPGGYSQRRYNGDICDIGGGIAGLPRYYYQSPTITTGLASQYDSQMPHVQPFGNAGGAWRAGRADYNRNAAGGGGGSNARGSGGAGGWAPGATSPPLPPGPLGGQGAGPFSQVSRNRLVMGGGGGGGGPGSENTRVNAGQAGGGIILIRGHTITGSGILRSNGEFPTSCTTETGEYTRCTTTDGGGGGGGAGGSIAIFATGSVGGSLLIQANGGKGADSIGGAGGGGGSGGAVHVVAESIGSSLTFETKPGTGGSSTIPGAAGQAGIESDDVYVVNSCCTARYTKSIRVCDLPCTSCNGAGLAYHPITGPCLDCPLIDLLGTTCVTSCASGQIRATGPSTDQCQLALDSPSAILSDDVLSGTYVISGHGAVAGYNMTVEVIVSGRSLLSSFVASSNDAWSHSLDLRTLIDASSTAGTISVSSSFHGATSQVVSSGVVVSLSDTNPQITAPLDGGHVQSSMVLTGTNDDAPLGSQVNVTLSDQSGGAVLKTVLASQPDNSFSETLDVSLLADGTYVVKVETYSTLGVYGTDSITIVKDPPPPTIAIDSPLMEDNVLSSSEDESFTISGRASSSAVDVSLQLIDQGDNSFSIVGVPIVNGVWTVTRNYDDTFAQGSMSIVATTANSLGSSSTDTASILVDTVAESLVITQPGSSFDPDRATAQHAPVSGTSEAHSVIALVFSDGYHTDVTDATNADENGAWSTEVDLSSLDGSISLLATETDRYGNVGSPRSASFTMRLNVVDILFPLENEVFNAATISNVSVSGTVAPNASFTLQITDGNDIVQRIVHAEDDGSWVANFNLYSLFDGPLTISASYTNEVGVPSQDVVTVQKRATRPSVSITVPVTADNVINFQEQSTTSVSGMATPTLVVNVTLIDTLGTETAMSTTADGSSGQWNLTNVFDGMISLSDGPIMIRARVADAYGNLDMTTTNVTLDTITELAIDPISLDDIITPAEGNSLVVSGVGEPEAALSLVASDESFATPDLLYNTEVDSHGNWKMTMNVSSLAFGNLVFLAQVVDLAGNSAATARAVFYNGTSMPLTIDVIGDQGVINYASRNDLFAISGSTRERATVTVIITDSASSSIGPMRTVAGAGGAWSIEGVDLSAMADGQLWVRASAVDIFGNTAESSSVVTKDTVASNLSIQQPITDDNVISDAEARIGYTFTGTAEVNARVDVVVRDDAGNTFRPADLVLANAQGLWSATVNLDSIGDGDATVSATQNDTHANSSLAPLVVSFRVDRLAPSLSIDQPLNGTSFNSAQSRALLVSGSTDPGVLVRVEVDDGTDVITRRTSGDEATGSWSVVLDVLGLDDGQLVVSAFVSDMVGNGANAQQFITKDSEPPVLTVDIDLSANGDNMINLAESNSFAVSGTGVDGLTVSFAIIDSLGAAITDTAVVSGGLWSKIPADSVLGLAQGPLTIQAQETDAVGNVARASASVLLDTEINVTIDVVSADDVISQAETESLRVSGTGEPGSAFTLTVDDQANVSTIAVTESFTVPLSGLWSVTLEDLELSPGTWTFAAQATDLAGNTASDTRSVEYDPSSLALTIDLPISGDNVVNFDERSSVELRGTTAAFATVTVTISDRNNIRVGPKIAVAGSSGEWQLSEEHAFDTTSLADGVLYIHAVSIDEFRNVANTGEPVLKDTVADNLAINAPITPDNVINAGDVRAAFSFTGTAESGASVAVTVRDAADNTYTPPIPVIADEKGLWLAVINISTISDGEAEVTASQIDVHGNRNLVDAKQSFFVSRDSPALQLTDPIEGAQIGSSQVSAVIVSGSTDPLQMVTITIRDGEDAITRIVTADSEGIWSLSVDVRGLDDGILQVAATAINGIGNEASVSHTITKDTIAPLLSIQGSMTANGDDIINRAEVETFTVDGRGENGLLVWFNITDSEGVVITDSAPVVGGVWTAVPSSPVQNLAEGALVITAWETDAAGNTAYDTKQVRLDTFTETVILNTPIAGDDIINAEEKPAVTIRGSAEANSRVQVVVSQSGVEVMSPVLTQAESTGEWQVTLDLSSVSDGNLAISASSVDEAGNPNEDDVLSHVSVVVTTISVPLRITAPADGVTINGEQAQSLVVSGTFQAFTQVDVTLADSALTLTTPRMTDESGSWSLRFNMAVFADGLITITANGTDTSGNRARDSITVLTDAEIPPLTVTSPIEGLALGTAASQAFVVSGTGVDGDSIQVSIMDTLGVSVRATVAVADSIWSTPALNLTTLQDGPLKIAVAETSPAGNKMNVVRSILLDTTAPQATIFAPTSTVINQVASQQPIQLQGSTEIGATVKVEAVVDGAVVAVYSAAVSPQGIWTQTIDFSDLPDGIVTITATSTDHTGNEATPVSIDLVKDTSPPPVFIEGPAEEHVINKETQSSVTAFGTAEFGSEVEVVATDGRAVITQSVALADEGILSRMTPTMGVWSAQLDLSSLRDGALTVQVRATDAAGNVNQVSVELLKDTAAPVLTINATLAGDNIINYQEAKAFVVSGATEGLQVTFAVLDSLNERLEGTATATNGQWISNSLDVSSLSDGTLVITATTYDASGNVAIAQAQVTKKTTTYVEIDVPITGDDLVSGLESASVRITGQGEPLSPVHVKVSDDVAFAIADITTSITGSFSTTMNLTSLQNGQVTATITLTDEVGNTATDSHAFIKSPAALFVTVDSPSPDLVINAESSSAVMITGKTQPNTVVLLTASTDSRVERERATSNDAGQYSIALEVGAFPDGVIQIQASVSDGVDIFYASSSLRKDTTVSTTTIRTPIAGDNIINANEIFNTTVFGTGEAGSAMEVQVGALTPVTITVDASGSWETLLNLSGASQGSMQVQATETDVAGNTGTPVIRVIEVDTLAPVLSIAPVTGDDVINKDEMNEAFIRGTSDGFAGDKLLVTLSDNALVLTLATFLESDGSWSTATDISSLRDGRVEVRASLVDRAGNEGTATRTIAKNTQPPVVTIDESLANNRYVSESELPAFIVSGTGVPMLRVMVSVVDSSSSANIASKQVVVDPQGQWTATFDLRGRPDGQYTLVATETDASGNRATVEGTVMVDTVSSNLRVTTPIAGDNIISESEKSAVLMPGMGEPGSTIRLTLTNTRTGDVVSMSTTVASNGQWFIIADLSDMPDTDNLLVQVSQTDLAGNVASAADISVRVDTTSLAVAITTPIEGDNRINAEEDDMVTIAGTGNPGATLQVVIRDSQGLSRASATVTVPVSGLWSVTVPGVDQLAEGTLTVTATSTDEMEMAVAVQQVEHQSRLMIKIDSPLPSTHLRSSIPLTISGRAAAHAFVVVSVADAGGQSMTGGTLVTDSTGEWWTTLDVSSLRDGPLEVLASASDTAGNSAADQVRVLLASPTADPLSPLPPPPPSPVVIVVTTPVPVPVPTPVVVYILPPDSVSEEGDEDESAASMPARASWVTMISLLSFSLFFVA